MTPIGCGCLVFLMTLAAFGILLGRVRGKDFSTSLRCARNDRRANAGAGLPTVTGETVRFRTAELRFVSCRASMEIGREQMEERGFDPMRADDYTWARRYWERELACLLAEQALQAGAIEFEDREGVLRARMKTVLTEGKP